MKLLLLTLVGLSCQGAIVCAGSEREKTGHITKPTFQLSEATRLDDGQANRKQDDRVQMACQLEIHEKASKSARGAELDQRIVFVIPVIIYYWNQLHPLVLSRPELSLDQLIDAVHPAERITVERTLRSARHELRVRCPNRLLGVTSSRWPSPVPVVQARHRLSSPVRARTRQSYWRGLAESANHMLR